MAKKVALQTDLTSEGSITIVPSMQATLNGMPIATQGSNLIYKGNPGDMPAEFVSGVLLNNKPFTYVGAVRRNLTLIFLLALFISCNGQSITRQKKEEIPAQSKDTAMESYLKQEHRFEFRQYKMYYNGQLVKADSLKNIYKIFGKPKYDEEVYDDKPLSIKSKSQVETDSKGRTLITFKGNKYPVNEENYHYFEEGGNIQVLYDKEGDTVKIADSFRIQLSKHTNPLTYGPPSENTKKLMSIPPLKGYVLINGVLVGKNTGMQELINKLGKIKNGGLFSMTGIPVIIYEPEPGHSFTEYDQKIDPSDDYIKISFGFDNDAETKESNMYCIDYHYSIKQ